MSFDFDEVIDRKNTNSVKYDFAGEMGMPGDAIPLWVADMDFRVPPSVTEALVKASKHGIFGYSEHKDGYFQALYNWYAKRFGWKVDEEWLVKTPGVVYAISTAIRALTKEGDAVMIQRPVYYPFSQSILANDRKLVNNPLINKNGHYEIDISDFEEKIVQNQVKLFILCNPHNPVGRVWTEEELVQMGDICLKHGVKVVSDEIHADFVFPGYRHTVFASIKEEYADMTIACTAPSKTFNLAGLQNSNIFIANEGIRQAFKDEINRTGYGLVNTMGLIACQAAYEGGADWLDALKDYLKGNVEFVQSFLKSEIPQIKLIEPEGTYLLWLDCRELNLEEEQLKDLIVNQAKLWLDAGTMFGPEGQSYQRMNIACPRSTIEKALNQLKSAINKL